jgi:hypothetical protein
MMKRLKTSTRFLIAYLVLCVSFAAGLLVTSQIVLAAPKPIPGIGVAIRKNPPKGKPSNARTNQDGKFTVGSLEPGNYTLSLKHADYSPPDNFRILIITIEGGRGNKVEKRFPISELRRGITFDIEIERNGGTLTGTCMATDEPR